MLLMHIQNDSLFFLTCDAGEDGEVHVVKARRQGALCIDHLSQVSLQYRHCQPGEVPESVSLLEVSSSLHITGRVTQHYLKVGESISGDGRDSRLEDTSSSQVLKRQRMSSEPELGESNADNNGESQRMSTIPLNLRLGSQL